MDEYTDREDVPEIIEQVVEDSIREYERTFKVSMDDEQKKLKNFKKITVTIQVPDSMIDHAIEIGLKGEVIRLQGQCRSNWDRIEKEDYPKTLVIGDSWIGTGKGGSKVRPPTDDEVSNFIMTKLSQQGIQYLVSNGSMPPKETEEYWK